MLSDHIQHNGEMLTTFLYCFHVKYEAHCVCCSNKADLPPKNCILCFVQSQQQQKQKQKMKFSLNLQNPVKKTFMYSAR